MEESENGFGTCCMDHFNKMMMTTSTFNQFQILLQVIEIIQHNGIEIPRELLEKMLKVTHLAGIRCRYDSCSYDRTKPMGLENSD